MGLKPALRRLFGRIERFSWGGEIVARHKVTKHVIVTELTNPVGVHLSVGTEQKDSARLTADEAIKLAKLLNRIAQKSKAGVTS